MAGTRRRLRVHALLKERGWNTLDLIRRPEFLLPPATAYRVSREDAVVDRIGLDLLERLSAGFGVPVEALWEWEEVLSG